jgi:hypothetical protein
MSDAELRAALEACDARLGAETIEKLAANCPTPEEFALVRRLGMRIPTADA